MFKCFRTHSLCVILVYHNWAICWTLWTPGRQTLCFSKAAPPFSHPLGSFCPALAPSAQQTLSYVCMSAHMNFLKYQSIPLGIQIAKATSAQFTQNILSLASERGRCGWIRTKITERLVPPRSQKSYKKRKRWRGCCDCKEEGKGWEMQGKSGQPTARNRSRKERLPQAERGQGPHFHPLPPPSPWQHLISKTSASSTL